MPGGGKSGVIYMFKWVRALSSYSWKTIKGAGVKATGQRCEGRRERGWLRPRTLIRDPGAGGTGV